MLDQAADLLEECDALHATLSELAQQDWERPTPFKDWTVNQVVRHLHGTDLVALRALTDPDGFRAAVRSGRGLPGPQGSGRELLAAWQDHYRQLCTALDAADPKQRVPWFGPDMSVRMFASARQMETWAHGQDVYDLLGKPREHTDRLKHIAQIGVRTFGWTFVNRGLPVPEPMPYVELVAPSGARWTWGAANPDHYVRGQAVAFCHVVTQGRNIADVELEVVGEPATQWMAIAQCFAGPPENPPPPGRRV